MDFASRGYESSRSAAPYVSAVKEFVSKPTGLVRSLTNRLGLTKRGLPTVSDRMGGLLNISDDIMPLNVATRSERVITAVGVSGKIDPQVYLSFLRNVPPKVAQKWLGQMGGITPPQIAQLTKPLPVMIKYAAFEVPTGTGAFAIGAATIFSKPVSERRINRMGGVPAIAKKGFAVSTGPTQFGSPFVDTGVLEDVAQGPALKQWSKPITDQDKAQEIFIPEPPFVDPSESGRLPYWLPNMKGGEFGSFYDGEGSLSLYERGRRRWKIATGEEALQILF
jgi:hypothetical protein